jgi:hypothetical protein
MNKLTLAVVFQLVCIGSAEGPANELMFHVLAGNDIYDFLVWLFSLYISTNKRRITFMLSSKDVRTLDDVLQPIGLSLRDGAMIRSADGTVTFHKITRDAREVVVEKRE